jgi:hypothetical protein
MSLPLKLPILFRKATFIIRNNYKSKILNYWRSWKAANLDGDVIQNFNLKVLSRKIESNDNWNDRIGVFGKGICDGSIYFYFFYFLSNFYVKFGSTFILVVKSHITNVAYPLKQRLNLVGQSLKSMILLLFHMSC